MLKHYRPVSLLSVTGMVLEKVVAVQIEDFFEESKLFGSFQFGFRKNKSTVSEMLTVFDTLLEAKEMKKDILLLMYDLSSAFHCVSHEFLLGKLKIYGFNDNSMQWIKSFLEQRKQMVTVAGKLSTAQEINIGTPQGSRLSPLLFICMMADMDLYTEEKLANFADDTHHSFEMKKTLNNSSKKYEPILDTAEPFG